MLSIVSSKCVSALLAAGVITGLPVIAVAQQRDIQQTIGLGLRGTYFVPNQGQWGDEGVAFALRGRGADVAFRASALTMQVMGKNSNDADLTFGVSFPDSNNVMPIGAKPQAAKFNYFVGGEERGAASDVSSYGEVVYENLYNGVDLHVTGSDGGVLKYEFHVAPGADYGQIRIAYDGIESLCVDAGGDLRISTSLGILNDAAPVVWQTDDVDQSITGHFELIDDHTYHIAVDGVVDPNRELVIDPVVLWSLYLGGSLHDRARDVALDSNGNIFVTGSTISDDFEGALNTPAGVYDAFAAKVSPAGELQWMTYLGGAVTDDGYGIAIGHDGSLFLVGETISGAFRGRLNSLHGDSFPDAYLAKVSPMGRVQGMLYIGGSQSDYGRDVSIDDDGNVLIAGQTTSADFDGALNELHGENDTFVAKVNASTFGVEWSRYLGGSDYEFDQCSVAVDGQGNAIVCGNTYSTDFEGRINQHHGGVTDNYVAKVNGSGDLQWMTYVGGSEYEANGSVAVDGAGNSYLAGSTLSPDLESAINAHHGNYDAYVTKVDPSGAVQWSRYLGGSDGDSAYAIAADDHGDVVLTGPTRSWDAEGQNNSFDFGFVFGQSYVAKVSGEGELLVYSYFVGGGFPTEYVGLAVGPNERAVLANQTTGDQMEGRLNEFHGFTDAYVVAANVHASRLSVAASCPEGGPIQVSWQGVTPNAPVALVFGQDATFFLIPEGLPCAEGLLNVGGIHVRMVFRGMSGPNGSRTLNATAGPDACGGYLQLIDLSTCDKSNVVQIQ